MRNLKCPWCAADLDKNHPGVRRETHKIFGVSTHNTSKQICPHCNNPIALDKKSKLWLLLTLPLLLVLFARAIQHKDLSEMLMNAGTLEWSLLFLSLVGAFMQWATEKWEKAN